MNKLYSIFTLVLISKFGLFAQNNWRAGGGIDLYPYTYSFFSTRGFPQPIYEYNSEKDIAISPTVYLSKDFLLKELNKNIGITINPNIGIGGYTSDKSISYGDVTILFVGYQATYLTFRYGLMSSENTNKSFGIGIGGGYKYIVAYIIDTGFNKLVPSFDIEFMSKSIGLRFETVLGEINTYYKTTTGDIPRFSSNEYLISFIVYL